MEYLLYVIGIFLLIASIIDWKFKALPSVLLTAMLFTVAIMHPENLWFGVLAFIIAYLLYELNFFSGVADVKIMTMMGFMIPALNWFFALVILTVIFGFVWKVVIKWRLKKEKETAFIPVFLFVYLTMILLGGIA